MISPVTFEVLMHTLGHRLPLVVLVLANLVPLYGVVWADWDAGLLIVLYWAENLIIGFYCLLKILLAGATSLWGIFGNLFIAAFFCLHYGGFVGVHGIFVFELIQPGGQGVNMQNITWPMHLAFLEILLRVVIHMFAQMTPVMFLALSLLFISHGFSFVMNYLVREEYHQTTARSQMFMPYGRIVIMHITLIVGAIFVTMTGSPMPLLAILVILKIVMDILLHIRSHKMLGTSYQTNRKKSPDHVPECVTTLD